MPRPGPRPYECVKRAWHSDRHQPIRGSLIREIFRIANEIHTPATRKNKEWQEKLPSVVFKAEEIIYSKASSEDEYVDLNTLWERVNDAVDTIIRRDDVNESGDLLLPCIEGKASPSPAICSTKLFAWLALPHMHMSCRHAHEDGPFFLRMGLSICRRSAALTLGCIPRRASRSQRHSNPRCYLSSSGAEEGRDRSSSVPCSSQKSVIDGGKAQLLGHHPPYSLQLGAPWFSCPPLPPTAASAAADPRDEAFIPMSQIPRLPGFRALCYKPEKTTAQESSGRAYPLCYLESSYSPPSSFQRAVVRSCDGKNLGKESRSEEGLADEDEDEDEAENDGGCDLSLQLRLPESCGFRKRSRENEGEGCHLDCRSGSRPKQTCLSGGRNGER